MMRWKDKKEWLQGLTEDQVKESAAKYGVNELERQEPASLWSMFLGLLMISGSGFYAVRWH